MTEITGLLICKRLFIKAEGRLSRKLSDSKRSVLPLVRENGKQIPLHF